MSCMALLCVSNGLHPSNCCSDPLVLVGSTVIFTQPIAWLQADGLSARLTAMDERLRVLAAQPAPLPDIQPQLQVAVLYF